MEKVHNGVNSIWKRAYMVIPASLLFFYILGFFMELIQINQIKKDVLDENYNHSAEFNGIMLEVYDNFSAKAIVEYSVRSGIFWAFFFTGILLYIILLLWLISSEKESMRILGIFLITATAISIIILAFIRYNATLIF